MKKRATVLWWTLTSAWPSRVATNGVPVRTKHLKLWVIRNIVFARGVMTMEIEDVQP